MRAAVDTKERVVAAASELFAAHGFHGTKMRDIAAQAGVNLASANYHFGSKESLYLEVLRAQFGEVTGELERRGATPAAEELRNASRRRLVEVLEERVAAMLDLLLGPPVGLHGTLMQREMCDPSEALPVIVSQFIAPQKELMERILARLFPRLDGEQIERCVCSIVGQVFFYRTHLPAMRLLLDRKAYRRGWAREVAAHVTEFSLGGMERLVARRKRRRAPRGPA